MYVDKKGLFFESNGPVTSTLHKTTMVFFALSCFSCVSAQDQDTSFSEPAEQEPAEEEDPMALIDSAQLPASAQACREPILVEVQYVIDGDTFHVRGPAGEERVRTIGINTPELGYDGDPDDCYAEEAKLKLEELIGGKSIWLSFDETCADAYDRTLAIRERGTFKADAASGIWLAYPTTPAF